MADLFASGTYRKSLEGPFLDTKNYTKRDSSGNVIAGGITEPDLKNQGYSQFLDPSKQREYNPIFEGKNIYKSGVGQGVVSGGKFALPSETIDTRVKAPNFLSGLPMNEEAQRQEDLNAEIQRIKLASADEIKGIREGGKKRLGTAKGFLAKIGALGRTVSGAPVDTNLGVLSDQNNMIEEAVNEEYANMKDAIAAAKSGSATAAKERVDALNELRQKNFDNALALLKEDREMNAEERQDKLADLQIDKLNFEIMKLDNDLSESNKESALDSLALMIDTPLDQLQLEKIDSLAEILGVASSDLIYYIGAEKERANIATEENIAKVDKIRNDILEASKVDELEVTKEKLEIEKLMQELENPMSDLDRQKKELEIEKLKKSMEDAGQTSDYSITMAEQAIKSVADLRPLVSDLTTGWGAFLTGKIPASEAKDFKAKLDTLKANIGFSALNQMREASKTGGALGQVSERELTLLTSVLGGLDQQQSSESFKGELDKIEKSINTWLDAVKENQKQSTDEFEGIDFENLSVEDF